jgi:pimeloyl-ACP methyl ester carboxylesterase
MAHQNDLGAGVVVKRINIGAIDLNVEVCGSGRPLLLVHGFPLDHTMWQGQIQGLGDSCQVIAPDLRGFGKSDVTAQTVSMQQFADDLCNLLTVLGIHARVTFCGLSMGGYIAWEFYSKYAERLHSLILCDTRAAADADDLKQTRMETATRVLGAGPQFLVEGMIPKLFCERTRQANRTIVDATRQVMLQTNPVGIAAALRGMAQRPDAAALLAHINVPTTVICGQFDVISPPSEMRAIADAIPNAQFVQISNAGHLAPLENPDDVNRAIRGWMSDLAER